MKNSKNKNWFGTSKQQEMIQFARIYLGISENSIISQKLERLA